MHPPPTEDGHPSADDEEIKALERIVLAFRSYAEQGRCEVGRWRRQFGRLDDRHRKLLPSFSEKCRRATAVVETNQFFLNAMLTSLQPELEASGLVVGDITEDMRSPPQDVEKVRYVLKNLVRDWTREGMEERRATYTPIVKELKAQFCKWEDWTKPPKVLIPGCGLGRLVAEIASAGFEAEGNEFSYFMLIPSSFMLNHTLGVDFWTIHPWALSTCNQVSDEDQLREVPLPDIDVQEVMRETKGCMSVVAGDFVDVYSREEYRGTFDAVVTSFFIDTAHNILEYLEVIEAVLKPGGYWINLGPLLYHWADSLDSEDLSIEIPLQEIQRIAESMGFKTLDKTFVSAPYLANPRAMFQTVYRAVFWTMQKKQARTLKTYAKTTPFTFDEILRLSAKFRSLDEDDSGRLEFHELCRLMEMRSNPFARRLCRLFSEDGSESLTFRQFVNLTGIFSERTNPEIKLVWAFAMWDFDGDDLIGAHDIKTGLRLISSSPPIKAADGNSARTSKSESRLKRNELDRVLERVFAEVDPMDAGLTFTDFKSVVSRMPDFFANFRVTV